MDDDQEQGFYYQIPGGLLDKDVIEIHGRFLGDSDISVRLLAEDSSPELNRTLPFGFLLTSQGKWSVECMDSNNKKHEQSGNVRLPENRIFKIRIIAYNATYELYVNDTKLLTQPHVIPLSAVSHLAIDGEAEFTSVEFKDLNSEAESAQSEDMASSRSHSSASESNDRLPELTSLPGFVRLSQSRRSYNRKPDDPVMVPLNSSIRRRESDLHAINGAGEPGAVAAYVTSSQPSLQANAAGANSAPKANTLPVLATKDKDKRRSSSRLLDKLHRRKSSEQAHSKEGQNQQAGSITPVWNADVGVEMSVDSKEIYKGTAASEPNLVSATNDGKDSKHKSSKHLVFSRHSKDSKDSKRRSASSPPNISKTESDKKKHHSSFLGSHKSKSSKAETGRSAAVQPQGRGTEYSVAGAVGVAAAPAQLAPLMSNTSMQNRSSLQVKPYPKGKYDLSSAERSPGNEAIALKSVATLPPADSDTNVRRLPRSQLDESKSPLVVQPIFDASLVNAAPPEEPKNGLRSPGVGALTKQDTESFFSWSRSSNSPVQVAPSKKTVQDGVGGNPPPVMVVTSADNVQYSMPPAEATTERENTAPGTALNKVEQVSTPARRVSFDHYKSSAGKQNPKSATQPAGSVAVATAAGGAKGKTTHSKDKKGTETKKSDKKHGKDKKSKSEPALNESGDPEKRRKRDKVADAFKKIFHRKKKKKSKGKNAASSKPAGTGAGAAGAAAEAAAAGAGAAAVTASAGADLEHRMAELHDDSEYESDYSDSDSSLSLDNAQVNNTALAASTLHGDEPALEGNHSVASLTTDTSAFYPRHIEIPAVKTGTETHPDAVPVAAPLGRDRLHSRSSDDHESSSRSRMNSFSSDSARHSIKEETQKEPKPLVVSSNATAIQCTAPPNSDADGSNARRRDEPGAAECGSKNLTRSLSTSSSSSGYSAGRGQEEQQYSSAHIPSTAPLIPTAVSVDAQFTMPPSSNQAESSAWDDIMMHSSLPDSKPLSAGRTSPRPQSKPLVEAKNDISGQQFAAPTWMQHHRRSGSSSSSDSSISTDMAGRIITVGQSRDFNERMNSYRNRLAGRQSKDDTKARDGRRGSHTSISSISSVDSDKLPPSLKKVKKPANGDSRGREAKQSPASQTIIDQQTKKDMPPSPKPIVFSSGNTKPPSTVKGNFWEDLATDSSSDDDAPRLSTIPDVR